MKFKKMLVSICAILLILSLMGCGDVTDNVLDQVDESDNVQTDKNNNGEQINENNDSEEELVEEEPTEIVLYFMKSTETAFVTEKETRKVTGEISPELVMEELLKGPEKEDLDKIIPEGTLVRGIEVNDGTAIVDFSSEIAEAYYGSESEAVLVETIMLTLTELPEIDAVQILVEGKKIESLGGHIGINEPLTR